MATTQEALNRSTNVNVADGNIGTIMARGIYRANNMSAGDPLTSGVICIIPGVNNRSGIRLGMNGKAERIGDAFIGVNGIAKAIKKGFIGVPSETHGLPAGYTEQEYIASNGTQWINTGVAPTTPRAELIMSAHTSNRSVGYFFGTYDGSSTTENFALGVDNEKKLFYRYRTNSSTATSTSVDVSQKHETIMSASGITVDGQTVQRFTGTYTKSDNFALFGAMNGSTPYNVNRLDSMNLYEAKIYDGNSLVRHFIPAVRASDNSVGLYDLVSAGFFTNSGTGAFIAGGAVSGNSAKLFFEEPLSIVPVTISGSGRANYVYVTINGTNYTGAATLNVEPGASIVCNVYGYRAQYPGTITVNGEVMVNITTYTRGTYTFVVPNDASAVTISLTNGQQGGGKGMFYYYGTIDIDWS